MNHSLIRKFIKLCLAIILFHICQNTLAQNLNIRAGLNLACMTNFDSRYSDGLKRSPVAGVHMGLTRKFSISEFLSVETGLLLTNKGSKLKWKDGHNLSWDEDALISKRLRCIYLDIPVTLVACRNTKKDRRIYGELGPYFGIGLSGTIKDKSVEDIISKYSFDFNSERFDYGLTMGGGIYSNNLRLGLAFDLGLGTIKNRVLRITAAYPLKSKSPKKIDD